MTDRAAAAGVIKHQIMWWWGGGSDTMVTTLWTHRTTTADWGARRADELTIIRNWISASWQSAAATAWSAIGVKSWRFDSVPPVKYADSPISPPVVGTRTGAGAGPAPSMLTAIVSLRTQAVGANVRGINGHIAWVGLCVDQYANNDLNGTATTLILARMNALKNAMQQGVGGTAQGDWCVVSFRDGGTATVPVNRTTPLVLVIDHLLVRSSLGIQRRRRARIPSFPVGS